jgi:hypothetical protein
MVTGYQSIIITPESDEFTERLDTTSWICNEKGEFSL